MNQKRIKLTKEACAEREKKVVQLWMDSYLNKTQIAKIVGITRVSEISEILKRNGAYNRETKKETLENENPCRVKTRDLPLCNGIGCYHAGHGSVCPAYLAYQERRN